MCGCKVTEYPGSAQSSSPPPAHGPGCTASDGSNNVRVVQPAPPEQGACVPEILVRDHQMTRLTRTTMWGARAAQHKDAGKQTGRRSSWFGTASGAGTKRPAWMGPTGSSDQCSERVNNTDSVVELTRSQFDPPCGGPKVNEGQNCHHVVPQGQGTGTAPPVRKSFPASLRAVVRVRAEKLEQSVPADVG